MSAKNENMKNEYYLPGLNANQSKQDNLSFDIFEEKTPKAYKFYKDTSAFYREYCDNLNNVKLREKRFLNFETPNRALITHEYDIRIENSFDYNKLYYLFNPIERLSWLQIFQEEKRLSVSESSQVKNVIKDILLPELAIAYKDSDAKFEELWKKKRGLPCFIKLEKTNYNDCLLTASYYDSIRQQGCDKSSYFRPLSERSIQYEYFPLKNKSSWLYIKAPENFNIKYHLNESTLNKDKNEIDYTNASHKEADPEKISLTIINRKSTNTKDDTENIKFDIIVPKSLKIWFLSLYYLTMTMFFILLCSFSNSLYLLWFKPLSNINPLDVLIKSNDFGGLVLAIIGAVIATRGWLIKEETILKKYSIYMTFMLLFIIVLYILQLFMQTILLL